MLRIHLSQPYGPGEPTHADAVHLSGGLESDGPPQLWADWAFGRVTAVVLPQMIAGHWGFWLVLEAADVPPGEHAVRLAARAGEASDAREVIVTVDPQRAWAPLREAPAPARTPWLTGPDPGWPALLVLATDPASAEAAADAVDQAHGHGEVLLTPGDLPAALSAFLARGLPWALLIDRPGGLSPHAVPALLAAAESHAGVDVVYGDDEVDGGRVRARTAWSPEGLMAGDDPGAVLLLGPEAALAGRDARDARELLLALDPSRHRVAHVPRILWSGPAGPPAEMVAPDAPPPAPVTAVIATAYRERHLLTCLRSLAGIPGLDVVLVDEGSFASRAEALGLCAEIGLPARAIAHPPPFNWSTANNLGAALGRGDELLFLNDDVQAPAGGAWLEAMRAWLHRPGVGVVGAKLVYPDGLVQHAGVTAGLGRIDNVGVARSADRGWRTGNASAVTGACMLVRRDAFEAAGGFDPGLAIEFADVDLPLRLARRGWRTVWAAEAELIHREGATRGRAAHPADHARFLGRWGDLVTGADPYGHPAVDSYLACQPLAAPAPLASREPPWAPGALERLAADGQALRLAIAREAAWLAGRARDDVWGALGTMRASRSWRWTAPLREARGRMRRAA